MTPPRGAGYDIVVVGAGASGLPAALRSATLGARVALVVRGRPGGWLRHARELSVVDGLCLGPSGPDVVERAVREAARLGIEVVTGEARELVPGNGEGHLVVVEGEAVLETRAVIAATGADRDLGRLEGAAHLLGAGVHTHGDPDRIDGSVRGVAVVVPGEVRETVRLALRLAGRHHEVVIAGRYRDEEGAVSGWAELQARPNVRALRGTTVVGVDGVESVEVVLLQDDRTGRVWARVAESLWIVGGERARTAWLPALLLRDASGRVATGARLAGLPSETAIRGVFAAGDVRVGAPGGRATLDDGVDAADQALARLGPASVA